MCASRAARLLHMLCLTDTKTLTSLMTCCTQNLTTCRHMPVIDTGLLASNACLSAIFQLQDALFAGLTSLTTSICLCNLQALQALYVVCNCFPCGRPYLDLVEQLVLKDNVKLLLDIADQQLQKP